jgi:membrane associated rhomboid family serine protease
MFPIRDTIRPKHRPYITWVILLLNTVVFLFELSLGKSGLQGFVNTFSLVPARLSSNAQWFAITLFTHMFLHGGWFHFLSNMWILFIFGDNVEDRMGPVGFFLFYVMSGLAAGGMQTLIDPASTTPALGASGAIAGVMGAYLLMYPRAKVVTWIPIFIVGWIVDVLAIFFLVFWFVSQLFFGVSGAGGVAWWAHIGGFVFGLLVSPLFRWRPQPMIETLADMDYIEPPRPDDYRW